MALFNSGILLANVAITDTFDQWRGRTNQIIDVAAGVSANNTFTGNTNTFKAVSANTLQISGATIIDNNRTISDANFQSYKEKIVSLGTVTTATNINLDLGNIFDVTLGANVTFTFTNPPAATFSQPATIVLRQDATGNRTATFTGAKYTDGLLPPLSTGATEIDVLTFFTIDQGTSYFGTLALANVA